MQEALFKGVNVLKEIFCLCVGVCSVHGDQVCTFDRSNSSLGLIHFDFDGTKSINLILISILIEQNQKLLL